MRPARFISAVSAAAVACAWAGLAHAASGGTNTAGSGQPVCNQDGAYNIACGASSTASGNTATAVGYGATASNPNAIAVGRDANAANTNAIAVGARARATGDGAITTGADSSAGGTYGSAYGAAATATGNYSTALGVGAESGTSPPIGQTGTNTTAVGAYSKAQGDYSTAIGSNAVAREVYSAAIGGSATAATNRSMALGPASYVTNGAPQGTAIGVYSNVTTSQSAAIGYGSVTSSGRANVVSVGSGGQNAVDSNGNTNSFLPAPTTRIIENVTDGQYSQDAATVHQLPGQFVDSSGTPSASPTNFYRFGNDATGSSAMTTGSSAVQLRNVAAGTSATDAVNVGQLPGTVTYTGGQGTVTLGNANAPGGNTNPVDVQNVRNLTATGAVQAGSVQTTGNANVGGSLTVSNGANFSNKTVSGVAAGTLSPTSTDAVNGSQLYATNLQIQAVNNQLEAVASSLRKQINATGAMAAAMSNIQLPPGYSKGLGVAIGSQRGQNALAIGFVATPKPNLLTRISASISGDTTSVGAGITFGW